MWMFNSVFVDFGMKWLKWETINATGQENLIFFCLFFSFFFCYSCWWRPCGWLLRSLLSAEWTWLSSHPLSVRIICLSLLFSLGGEWNSLSDSWLHMHISCNKRRMLDGAVGFIYLFYACRGEGRVLKKTADFGKQCRNFICFWRETYSITYAEKKNFKNANQIGTCRRKFLLILPPFFLSPSLHLQSGWQLGRKREISRRRKEGGPWINEQANKWVQGR